MKTTRGQWSYLASLLFKFSEQTIDVQRQGLCQYMASGLIGAMFDGEYWAWQELKGPCFPIFPLPSPVKGLDCSQAFHDVRDSLYHRMDLAQHEAYLELRRELAEHLAFKALHNARG